MGEARDTFLAHVENAETDGYMAELRDSLSKAKLETLDQVEGLDENGLKLVMPGLYQQIISTTIQMAASVGLAIGLALEAWDEHNSGASVSAFNRMVRQQMTETGVEMKRRHSSRIARMVAEIEAQRLAWRHNHEFLSWLAFRRGDERYPADDRRERMEAFKIQPRLLQSREAVSAVLGRSLASSLEAHDRFLLANRWRLAPVPEHAVERFAWPLLSYQQATMVMLETARNELDGLTHEDYEGEPNKDRIAQLRGDIRVMFREQLAASLDELPEAADLGRIG